MSVQSCRSLALVVSSLLLLGFLTGVAVMTSSGWAQGDQSAAAVSETNVRGIVDMKELHLAQGTGLAVQIIGANDRLVAILVRASKGFIVCSNFDLKALESRGVAAASVKGLTRIEDVLQASIVGTTKRASELGIKPGMSAPEALLKLM